MEFQSAKATFSVHLLSRELIPMQRPYPEGPAGGPNTIVLGQTSSASGTRAHARRFRSRSLSAGGHVKTGQAVMTPNGKRHKRLLLTIGQSMGLPSVTSFGNPKVCTDGPIIEIVA